MPKSQSWRQYLNSAQTKYVAPTYDIDLLLLVLCTMLQQLSSLFAFCFVLLCFGKCFIHVRQTYFWQCQTVTSVALKQHRSIWVNHFQCDLNPNTEKHNHKQNSWNRAYISLNMIYMEIKFIWFWSLKTTWTLIYVCTIHKQFKIAWSSENKTVNIKFSPAKRCKIHKFCMTICNKIL